MHLGPRAARTAAQRWTVLCLGCVLLLVSFTLTAIDRYLSTAQIEGVRQTLDSAPDSARAIQIGTGLIGNGTAQGESARVLLDRVFDGLPVRTYRTLGGGAPISIADSPTRASLSVQTADDFNTHARVVEGSWPTSTTRRISLALPQSSADSLQLRIGDNLTLNGTTALPCRVVAIFVADRPGDAYFFDGPTSATQTADDSSGNAAPGAGSDGRSSHSAVVDLADLQRLTDSVQVRWTITPDSQAILPDQIGPLKLASDGVRRNINNDASITSGGVQSFGDLAVTLAAIGTRLAAGRAVAPIPITLVITLGFCLILMLNGLLVRARRDEVVLLRSRGSGAWRLIHLALNEAAGLSVAAAAVGTVASMLVWRGSGITWWPAAFVFLSGVATASLSTARDALRRRALSVRSHTLIVAGPAVLLFAAAVVSMQRFRFLGSAVVVDAAGTSAVDPIAVLAPVLCLVACAVLGTLASGLIAQAVATSARRGRGIIPVLPARQLARGWPAFGVVTLLGSLAVGGIATAAAFDRTWTDYQQLTSQLANIADVRVVLPGVADVGFSQPDPAANFASRPGFSTITDALVTPAEVGDAPVQLMTLPAATMATALPHVEDGFDPAEAQGRLAQQEGGIPIPAGATHITLDLAISATPAGAGSADEATASSSAGFSFVLWIAGPAGIVIPLTAGDVQLTVGSANMTVHRSLNVPTPQKIGAGWRIVGLDSIVEADADTAERVEATNLTDSTPWSVQPLDDPSPIQSRPTQTIAWSRVVPAGASPATIRLMPYSGRVRPVPLIVNAEMADRSGLSVGAPLDLRLSATSRHLIGQIVGVSTVLPGAPSQARVLADTGAALIQLLRTTTAIPAINEVWLGSSSPSTTAAAAQSIAGSGAIITVARDQTAITLVQPVVVAFRAGAAAAILLAVMALATVAAAQTKDRRGERIALTALGMSSREQIRGRRLELTATSVAGLVIGAGGGLATALLTVGALARSAVPQAAQLIPAIGLADAGWFMLLALCAGATAVILTSQWAGRR